jgi:hypothetical protein
MFNHFAQDCQVLKTWLWPSSFLQNSNPAKKSRKAEDASFFIKALDACGEFSFLSGINELANIGQVWLAFFTKILLCGYAV